MAELLTLFKKVHPDGPYDRSDGNRLRPVQSWPGLWSLPTEDQSIVAEVSLGRRRRALLLDGLNFYLIEHQPGIRELTGDATGYTVRTLEVPAQLLAKEALPAPAPPPPAPAAPRSPLTAWLLLGVLALAILAGAAGHVLVAQMPVFSPGSVPESENRDREKEKVEPLPVKQEVDPERLKRLEQEVARLHKQHEELARTVGARRPDETLRLLESWHADLGRHLTATRAAQAPAKKASSIP